MIMVYSLDNTILYHFVNEMVVFAILMGGINRDVWSSGGYRAIDVFPGHIYDHLVINGVMVARIKGVPYCCSTCAFREC